jgi:hypothetical protein
MLPTPTIHLGSPTQVGPLTVFPVWTDAPVPERPLRTTVPRSARIGEVDGGAVVERLTVHNPTAKSFLLPAGGIFEGGQQHRVVLHSVVVGAESRLDLDVRCVEQGRWSGGQRQRLHRRRAPLAVRGALSGIVARGDARRGHHPTRGDQGRVWDQVSRYEERVGRSHTGSLLEATARAEEDLVRALDGLRPLLGQRGVLIGIGGHPALLEVFDHPKLLASEWAPILTGIAADAVFAPVVPTTGRRARIFAEHVSNRALRPWTQAGAAVALEHRDDLAVIDAVADARTPEPGAPIHLTALNPRHALVAA